LAKGIGSEDARVSAAIVIPAFNAAATIVETLYAIQACPGVTQLGAVFICDDASTDNTCKLASDAWTSMPKLTILKNAQRLGERSTVNAAFGRLRKHYEWIFILHADDVVKENWLKLYFQRIKAAEPRVASICSSYDWWNPEANRIDSGEDDFSRDLEIIRGTRESVLDTLRAGCWWHISGCAIRVEQFFEIGGFRAHLPQLGDFEWLLRCLKLGYDVEYIPRTTMLYRIHSASVSSKSFRRAQDLIEQLEIFGTYCNESYLTKQEFRAVRMRIVCTALKRIVTQFSAGKFQNGGTLLSVCWRALQSEGRRSQVARGARGSKDRALL
jgi:GT2 family glycosyltransferase